MTTYRVAHRRRYTSVDRATVNDDTLSFRARGVLVWLLDKPDDWRCDSEAIARAGKEGREAVRAALRELDAAGYLRREKVRGDRGRWLTITTVYERPETEPTEDGFPGVGGPGAGNPGAKTEDEDKRTETERETPSPSAVADEVEVAPPDPHHEAAHRLAVFAYEQTPKPTTRGGFPAVHARCKELLAGGWTPDQVAYVIRHQKVRTWSLDSLTFALTKERDERAGKVTNGSRSAAYLNRPGAPNLAEHLARIFPSDDQPALPEGDTR